MAIVREFDAGGNLRDCHPTFDDRPHPSSVNLNLSLINTLTDPPMSGEVAHDHYAGSEIPPARTPDNVLVFPAALITTAVVAQECREEQRNRRDGWGLGRWSNGLRTPG